MPVIKKSGDNRLIKEVTSAEIASPNISYLEQKIDNKVTVTRTTFINANLVSGVLTVTHSKGLSAPYTILVQVFDNSGQLIIPDQVTGSTNSFTVDLTSYGTLSGTWGLIYSV